MNKQMTRAQFEALPFRDRDEIHPNYRYEHGKLYRAKAHPTTVFSYRGDGTRDDWWAFAVNFTDEPRFRPVPVQIPTNNPRRRWSKPGVYVSEVDYSRRVP